MSERKNFPFVKTEVGWNFGPTLSVVEKRLFERNGFNQYRLQNTVGQEIISNVGLLFDSTGNVYPWANKLNLNPEEMAHMLSESIRAESKTLVSLSAEDIFNRMRYQGMTVAINPET